MTTANDIRRRAGVEIKPQRLLVIVHPGSACGSADMNLGKYDAQAARDGLVWDIGDWNESIVVIDGGLSDELTISRYKSLGDAIAGALQRAAQAGLISTRLYGDDAVPPHQDAVAQGFIRSARLDPKEWMICLTGAWTGSNSGCVNGVEEVFRRAGFRTDILDSAVSEPAYWDDPS